MHKPCKKAICCLLAILILSLNVVPAMADEADKANAPTLVGSAIAPQTATAAAPTVQAAGTTALDAGSIALMEAQTYKEFLAAQGAKDENDALAKGGSVKELPVAVKTATGDCTVDGENVKISEEGFAKFQIPAVKDGLYQVQIEYDVAEDRTRDVECAVLVDGKLPFEETRALTLPRLWRNELKEIEKDANNNDITPAQVSMTYDERGWLKKSLNDASGFYSNPLLFDFKGAKELTLVCLRESLTIHSITLVSPEEIPSYAEYAENYKGVPDATEDLPVMQGEQCDYKNDATLTPQEDRISVATYPREGSKIRLNYIGGKNWSTAGQEITWKFEVKEAGKYAIRFRSRQLYSNDLYSARIVKVDGKIPFKEAADIHFTYDSDWIIYTINVNEEECKFYFGSGQHELSLCVTLGDFGPILERLETSVAELNSIYRELIMVMSSTPDTDRDYNLETLIPEVLENMSTQSEVLYGIADDIEKVSGSSGSSLSSIRKAALQMKEFNEEPNTIATQLKYFKDNIASLSEVMTGAQSRPIDIDYISIAAPSSALPKAEGNFFKSLIYKTQLFISSFVEDYNSLAGTSDGVKTQLTVWTTLGRDQASIINELIRSSYTQDSDKNKDGQTVGVELQVVPVDALMPSVAAGNGPDVIFNATSKLPVEYAMRGASANLRKEVPQDELEEVLARFTNSEQAIYPFEYDNGDGSGTGLYALPDQFLYTVMFYRTDVLKQLNIEAPTIDKPWTWDKIIDILPTLQSNNMSILMETGDKTGADVEQYGINTYAIFLYQHGGSFYSKDFTASALSEENAVEAFEIWTNLYTSYGLPTNFDMLSRFRTGESPILLSDFPFYNNLSVSAPELKGLWSMALVPGTVQEDGTVNQSTKGGGTAVIMMDAAEDKLAAWDFMKWWTSTETQSSYAQKLESLLGTAARYATANKEAFNSLAWSKSELEVLNAESVHSMTIPETPGSYYTPRHINNAFRAVCIKEDADDAREAVLKYAQIITDEISTKREEFGLTQPKKEVNEEE